MERKEPGETVTERMGRKRRGTRSVGAERKREGRKRTWERRERRGRD